MKKRKNGIGVEESAKKRKYDIKALVLVVLILVLIDSVVLIMTDGFGKNLVANIVFDILEILATIWVITGNDIFKNKK